MKRQGAKEAKTAKKASAKRAKAAKKSARKRQGAKEDKTAKKATRQESQDRQEEQHAGRPSAFAVFGQVSPLPARRRGLWLPR